MEKKNNNLVIILMGVIIIILLVLCVLFAIGKIDLKLTSDNTNINNEIVNKDNKESMVSFDSLVGTYEYKEDNKTDENGNQYRNSTILYLNDDGTFVYRFNNGFVPYTYYGNYVLKDNNQLLLNVFLYNPTSGAELDGKHIKLDLTVDKSGNIIDETKESLSHVENKQILLNKTDDSSNDYKDFVYKILEGKDVLNSRICD